MSKSPNKSLKKVRERFDNLFSFNQIQQIISKNVNLDVSLQEIVESLSNALQYPDNGVKLSFHNKTYVSGRDKNDAVDILDCSFKLYDKSKANLEFYYTEKHQDSYYKSFSKQEDELIKNTANLLENFINREIGKTEFAGNKVQDFTEPTESLSNQSMLERFLNLNDRDRDVLYDLQPFKVKEILLFADLYDAYSLEKEGRIFEDVLGEYQQLNLISIPRITGVSNYKELFELLQQKHFDMLIVVTGVEYNRPMKVSKIAKQKYPHLPIFYLLNNNRDINFFEERNRRTALYDRLFVWNGYSNIFFAMIKMVEDRINLENDTKKGQSRIILLVEDSPKYYSRYMPVLYKEVMEQTKRIIDDVSTDDLYKLLRMRTRPKIVLATTYEGAMDVFENYKPHILAVITDVKFSKENKLTSDAGYQLAKFVRSEIEDMPIIMQSSNKENEKYARELSIGFIDKNSDNINEQFRHFLLDYLGFGDFVFKDANGKEISRAKSIQEFQRMLMAIPSSSLKFHAKRNHFSRWLMARGEINIAQIILPFTMDDFDSLSDIRHSLIKTISSFRTEKSTGKVVSFDDADLTDDANIISLAAGSLGGKGRGIAFLNNLIHNFQIAGVFDDINVKIPRTFVIGTDEFDEFIGSNDLFKKVLGLKDFQKIKEEFLKAKVSSRLHNRLLKVLRHIVKPLAVRSSGLLEDSLMQPFAGIFGTYLVPNNNESIEVRVKQLEDAIKLVFASVYSNLAKDYIQAVNYKLDEERMAIVIQEVVGNEYGDYFYPHISGTAQSFNYYPVANMNPKDGFSVLALGLGCYVAEGEQAYRFSPTKPKVNINSVSDQFKDSQKYFYAINMNSEVDNLIDGEYACLEKLRIKTAEKHGSINHIASVYDPHSKSVTPGLRRDGMRFINFANVIQYDYAPVAKTIKRFLGIIKEAMGSEIEIEFAVDLNKDEFGKTSFYLLQIKPLLGSSRSYEVNLDKLNKEKLVIFSNKGMGNGLIDDVTDVVFVDPEKFDKTKTEQIATEVNEINKKLSQEDRKFVLIGPGRWGTRDKWIGVPVKWPQISQAAIIIETDLKGFPLDASSGSHFFHNVTSMNVGYYSVKIDNEDDNIDYEKLKNQKIIDKTDYVYHIRFKDNLKIMKDGKKGVLAVEEA